MIFMGVLFSSYDNQQQEGFFRDIYGMTFLQSIIKMCI